MADLISAWLLVLMQTAYKINFKGRVAELSKDRARYSEPWGSVKLSLKVRRKIKQCRFLKRPVKLAILTFENIGPS